MYGDVVTTGQYCGINGCQCVTIEHKAGGLMDCSTELRNDEELAVACPLQNDKAAKIGISLVCKTSVGNWEHLLVEEGKLLLIDGQVVMVRKKK